MQKKHLKKKDIQYWYFAPIRINFHYNADGEDSFIDTTVDIPMTAALTAELKETAQERNTTYETVLEESLNAMLVDMKRDLHRKLPPQNREDCTITIAITGAITYSKKPLKNTLTSSSRGFSFIEDTK